MENPLRKTVPIASASTKPLRPPRSAYHHGELASALKEAALELVRERGTRGFSLNEAARRAGVSGAAPYRHFADKEALLAALAIDGYAILTESLQVAARGHETALDSLVATGVEYVRFAQRHREYFAVIFMAGIDRSSYPELFESAQRSFFVGTDSSKSMSPQTSDQRDIAFSAWAIAHGVATLASEGALECLGGDANAEVVARRLLKASITGLIVVRVLTPRPAT